MTFTAVYVNGDSGWIVAFAEEFPDIVIQGRTIEQARQRIREAVGILLHEYADDLAKSTADRPILLRETLEPIEDQGDAADA